MGTRPPPSSTRRSDAGLASTAVPRPRARPDRSTASDPTSSWTHSSPSSSAASMGSPHRTVPRMVSAWLRSGMPSKATIHRFRDMRPPASGPPWGVARPTTRVRSPANSTEPGAKRSGRLLTASTITSPRMPWAFTIRPTSRRAGSPNSPLIDDVEAGPDALPGPGRRHHLAQRLGHPAATADDLAHVGGRHVQAQLDVGARAPFADLHEDPVGIVDDVAGEVLEHALGEGADDPVALGSDLGPVVLLVVFLVLLEHHGRVVEFLVVVVVARVAVGIGVELVLAHRFFSARCRSQAPEMVRRLWTRSVGWAPLRSHWTARSLSMSTSGGS